MAQKIYPDRFNRMDDTTCKVMYVNGSWYLSNDKDTTTQINIEALIVYANIHRITISNKSAISKSFRDRLKY